MSTGAFVVTRDGEELIGNVVRNLQRFADHVLVFIDNRSNDHTERAAQDAGALTIYAPLGSHSYEHALNVCANYLQDDWLFYLHDDELIGQAFIDHLPYMMRNTNTAWKFNHYNMLSATEYITSEPYYPDAQLRLIPRRMWMERGGWPERVHASPAWPMAESTCAIYHYKFVVRSMQLRKRRLDGWIEDNPLAASDHYTAFSVFEGRQIQVAPVPEPALDVFEAADVIRV